MTLPDLNLLVALDVLLTEESVSRASTRLQLSSSAMSRTLSRLREATGDPLLVRAGRRLVPTPRALELREQAARLVHDAQSVLRPTTKPRLDHLVRTFSLRTSDGFVENFAPALVARIAKEAPGVRLRFVQKTDRDAEPLRTGLVDLETGVVQKETAPEFQMQLLFRDRFVGVVRRGHPLTKASKVTSARYAAGRHVSVSRHGVETRPIDDALPALGLERNIVAVVSGFAAALALVKGSDLIATVPDRHTHNLRSGMQSFRLPFATPELSVALLWHPRLDADVAHQWLRGCVREVCRGALRSV
ncbi:MAG TPA: LysR family transcriptional regulator [Gemmatimonadaceae bacterium]|jgi:DNA-binding transcriptional LysR family regulator